MHLIQEYEANIISDETCQGLGAERADKYITLGRRKSAHFYVLQKWHATRAFRLQAYRLYAASSKSAEHITFWDIQR